MASLRNVSALIATIAILQIAGGLLGVRLPLGFVAEGNSPTALGLVAACYSAGFMLGAVTATTLLARAGHIRVYAGCAAIFAAATLLLHFVDGVWGWGLARMVAGFAVALLFASVESWLASSILPRERGEVMSIYMVATKAALAVGPYFVIAAKPSSPEPWMIAAAIAALSMVPICFTSAVQPTPPKATPLALVEQFQTAPAAVIASFGAGFVNGGVLALAPLYAAELFGQEHAAEFYSAAWTGSLLLQWPAGRISDRTDRRLVIAALNVFAAIAAGLLALMSNALPAWAAVLLFFFWGAGALSFYGIGVAHMADRAEHSKMAQAAAGLLFVWAGGSVLGPIVLGPIVDAWGVAGMFWFAALAALGLAAAMFWRSGARGPAEEGHKEEFSPHPATSVAAGEIAYGEDDERKA
jgi:MFS family permease